MVDQFGSFRYTNPGRWCVIATKICEICGAEFEPVNGIQKYCHECGKNPERVRQRYATAVATNKRHAGEQDVPVEKECKNCGKKFLTVYKNREFCSEACGETYRIDTAECPVCHARLIDKGITTGRGYCSDECRDKDRLQKAIRDGNYIPCEQCGKNFIRPNLASRFCCKECYETYRETHKRTPAQPQKKPAITTKVCPVCKKIFPVSPFQTTKLYCSVKCRTKVQRTAKPKSATAKPETHLCTTCRVSQRACERFSSGFKKLPEGAELRTVKGQDIVVKCPKYR